MSVDPYDAERELREEPIPDTFDRADQEARVIGRDAFEAARDDWRGDLERDRDE